MSLVVDHRALQSRVRDQGKHRSTCVGFAVSAAHEWMAADQVDLSPEDAVWAGHQQGGSARSEMTAIRLALEGLAVHGHAWEMAWPYGAPSWPADRPPAACLRAQQSELPRWSELLPATIMTIEETQSAGVAVMLSLRVVLDAWQRPFDPEAGGLVDAHAGQVTPGGHAVLAVGVVDDQPAGRRAIVKNSWGLDWGVSGYGFVTERYLNAYLKRAFILEKASPNGP